MATPDATNRHQSYVKTERPIRVDFRNRGAQSAVVFVHGLRGHDEETWGAFPQLLMEHEQLQKWDVFGIGYSSNLRLELARPWSADAPLDVLGYYLRTMLVLPPLDQYRKVALVAHSVGGLVVQHALLDEETRKRVSHAFLFATPSAGVAKASMLQRFTLQTQEMLTGSEFIANLRAGWPEAYAGGKAFILRVIAGERDAFVPPDTSLQVKHTSRGGRIFIRDTWTMTAP